LTLRCVLGRNQCGLRVAAYNDPTLNSAQASQETGDAVCIFLLTWRSMFDNHWSFTRLLKSVQYGDVARRCLDARADPVARGTLCLSKPLAALHPGKEP